MDCSINNIPSFSNENLVKLIEKIGHYEAARIIQEKKIDGLQLLELTETETDAWELTNCQRNLLWKCISQIKSNPLAYLNICHHKHLKKILNEEKNFSSSKANLKKKYNQLEDTVPFNEVFTVVYENINKQLNNNRQPPPLPQDKKQYFKFCQIKKQESDNVSKRISLGIRSLSESNIIRNSMHSQQNLEDDSNNNKHTRVRRYDIHQNESRESFYFSCSSINENVFDSPRGSEYIYAPCLEGTKDNTTVNRIKKYVKLNPRTNFSYENEEFSKNSGGVYLELRNLHDSRNSPQSSRQFRDTHIYEEPPINIENSQEDTRKNSPVHFIFNLCCCSCYAGCTTKPK